MSNDKKRVEIVFNLKDTSDLELWQWLDSQEGTKIATEIKNILRKQMISETMIPIADLDAKIQNAVQKYCSEYFVAKNDGFSAKTLDETTATRIDVFSGKGREF